MPSNMSDSSASDSDLRATVRTWLSSNDHIQIKLFGEAITPRHIAALEEELKRKRGPTNFDVVTFEDIECISFISDNRPDTVSLDAASAEALGKIAKQCPNLKDYQFTNLTVDARTAPLWDAVQSDQRAVNLRITNCIFKNPAHNAASLLRGMPNLIGLELNPSPDNDKTFDGLADAIGKSQIRSFGLSLDTEEDGDERRGLDAETATQLFTALKQVPRLQNLSSSIPLSHRPEVTAALLDMVENQTDLQRITLNYGMTADEQQDFARKLANHPRLDDLFLMLPNINLDEATAFTQSILQHCPDIASILLDGGESSPSSSTSMLLSGDAHPSLTSCHPALDSFNHKVLRHNSAVIGTLTDRLHDSGVDWGSYETRFLYDVHRRANGVFSLGRHLWDARDGFDAFLATLPGLPENAEGWQVTNETGFAPVDNPRIWRDPGLGGALAQVDFTPDFLDTPSAKGMTFRMGAALGLSGGDFIQLMNGHGLRIGAAELLDGDGQPNPLFQHMIDEGKAPALFTPHNLHGAQPGEMRKLFSCLPQDQQRRADTHQYRALLNRSAPAQTTSAARGR